MSRSGGDLKTGLTAQSARASSATRGLRVGFVASSDCAPLVMARELGLFKKYDVAVELKREASWNSVLAKVVDGLLHAAQVPAALPFVANLSLQTPRDLCVSGMVLSLQGSAVTLARALWEHAGCDVRTLGDQIRKARRGRTYTFGTESPCSSQHFLLRRWLRSLGVEPDWDVRLMTVPPDQMFPSLKLGYLDGFCVGQPWTSLASEAGLGCCLATSRQLASLHPDKVLMVRRDFAEQRSAEHSALIAALLEAGAYCDDPANGRHISRVLADPLLVNAPLSCIEAGWGMPGPTDLPRPFWRMPALPPPGLSGVPREGASIFARANASEPSPDKAGWVVTQLIESGAIRDSSLLGRPAIGRVFRRDLFRKASRLVSGRVPCSQTETEALPIT